MRYYSFLNLKANSFPGREMQEFLEVNYEDKTSTLSGINSGL